jgi:hypothetical protein
MGVGGTTGGLPGWRGRAGGPVGVVTLVGLGVMAVLGAMLGPDLFLLLPWPVRWWVGELAVIAGLVGLPLFAVRRGWVGPWRTLDPSASSRQAAHRLVALGLQAATAALAVIPTFRTEYRAKVDWDFLYQHYEALRVSVLVYRQVPWWNPWNVGGFPLLGEPQVGLLSPAAALVFAFGTEWGVWLATILALMLAVEGARRLARLWLDDPAAVAVAAVVFGWNGVIVMFTVSCPALTWCYWPLPWLLWAAFQLGQSRGAAVTLGLVLAVAGLGMIQYPAAYGLFAAAAVVAFGGLARPPCGWRCYLARVALAGGIALTLAGWRLALVGGVMHDYPRRIWSLIDLGLLGFVRTLVDRVLPPPWEVTPGPLAESAAYLGVLPLGLALLGLRRGWRWWHTLAAVTLALALGAAQWYHLSYWLKDWPVFSTMHLVGRWRIVASLGIGLAAADAIQALRRGPSKVPRWLGLAAALVIVGDLYAYAWQLLPCTFDFPASEIHEPAPPLPRGQIVNLEQRSFHRYPQDYWALRAGYGVIRGYEPLLDYDRGRKTARLWRGHPDYVGESWSEGVEVAPTLWTPNRIEFDVGPGQEVELNVNPGSWWWVNGVRPFADRRCVEVRERFLARADDRGRLVVEARPPNLRVAALASLVGLVLTALAARPARGGT